MSKVAAIQMCSSDHVAENLQTAATLIEQAAKEKAALAVLPENFAIISKVPTATLKIKEQFGDGPIQDFLATTAKKNRIWIVGGTIPIAGQNENRATAACLVYNDKGEFVARYNKIHLFDVCVEKGVEEYSESNSIEYGKDITVVDTPLGKLGLAICYDLRFPELFRVLFNKGAEIFAVPAAFTEKTGAAHWELLTRTRAVENQCYLIAAAQGGTHSSGRKTFGHSFIVDPWGKIIASLPTGIGIITAEIDFNYLKTIRKNFPIREHQKIVFNT